MASSISFEIGILTAQADALEHQKRPALQRQEYENFYGRQIEGTTRKPMWFHMGSAYGNGLDHPPATKGAAQSGPNARMA
jgi:hypothetical protein